MWVGVRSDWGVKVCGSVEECGCGLGENWSGCGGVDWCEHWFVRWLLEGCERRIKRQCIKSGGDDEAWNQT